MSHEDDELSKIFDGDSDHSLDHDEPSSSSWQHERMIGPEQEHAMVPADPIASFTLDDNGPKRKTSYEGVGTKRVRIDASDGMMVDMEEVREAQFIEEIVMMGFSKAEVTKIFLMMGKIMDHNVMLDRLNASGGGGRESEERERERNDQQSRYGICMEGQGGGGGGMEDIDLEAGVMFHDPIKIAANASISNDIENMVIPTSTTFPQLQQPQFVDLCDELVLRRHLNSKFGGEEACRFVVKMAGLMGSRLSQVNYVSRVARLSEAIFSMSDLYKNHMTKLPSEPPSEVIDRQGIQRETEKPFGVLIDVAEAFVNNGGLLNIQDRIDDPAMSIKDIGHLCSLLADLCWLAFPRFLDELMTRAAERMRAMMAEYTAKEIREEKTRREIFEASRKVCKGLTPGLMTSPRYEFIERLLLCGNMEAKKNAMDELANICEHEAAQTAAVRRWMRSRSIFSVLLSDHLDHADYVVRLMPILRKAAPILSERQFRQIWCLQKGRGGINPDTFYSLLSSVVAGFQQDQILMFFRYFKKLAKSNRPNYQHAFLKMTDVVHAVLTSRNNRLGVAPRDRQLFIDGYYRLLDRFMSNDKSVTVYIYGSQLLTRTTDFCRGLPPVVICTSLCKIVKEICRMKELDSRFPTFLTICANLCNFIKMEIPLEYRQIEPVLKYFKFLERVARLLIAYSKNIRKEYDRVGEMYHAIEQMSNARTTQVRAEAAATAAAAASSSAKQTPELAVCVSAAAAAAAAAAAPPPSAVTPISNGPSPKRGDSPPGANKDAKEAATAAAAPAAPSTSNGEPAAAAAAEPAAAADPGAEVAAAPAAEQPEQQQPNGDGCSNNDKKPPPPSKQDAMHTPPHTPEPLKVTTARVGSKEWEKEYIERNCLAQGSALELSARMLQFTSLLGVWNDLTHADEPLPGCDLQQLPQAVLQEICSEMIIGSKAALTKRFQVFWLLPSASTSCQNVIKNLLKRFENKPLIRLFMGQIFAMAPEAVHATFIDLVRAYVDKCFIMHNIRGTTDWMREVLIFVWRQVVGSRVLENRERCTNIIYRILSDHYKSFRLMLTFTAARLNEAIDQHNAHSLDKAPLPHWREMRRRGEEDDEVEEMEEEESSESRGDEEEKYEETDDGLLEPAGKRPRLHSGSSTTSSTGAGASSSHHHLRHYQLHQFTQHQINMQLPPIEAVEAMVEQLVIGDEAKSLEDAEMRLARAVVFLRKIMKESYMEGEVNPKLVVRDRSIPYECVEMTMRMSHAYNASTIQTFCVTYNEPLWAMVDRVRKLLPPAHATLKINWPSGFKLRHFNSTVQWEKHWASVGEQLGLTRRGTEDAHILLDPSPFNEDSGVEVAAKKENHLVPRVHKTERCIAETVVDGDLIPVLHAILDRAVGSLLQESIYNCIQLLPLQPVKRDQMDTCILSSVNLQKPHEALFHLQNILATLLPPVLTPDSAARARFTMGHLRRTGFIQDFVRMLKEVDVITGKLSADVLVYFHETCIVMLRLFFLNASGPHRAYKKNLTRLPHEPAPLDCKQIADDLIDEEWPRVLRALMSFVWSTVAPRRRDVEKELLISVPQPTVRLALAREKRVDNTRNNRRTLMCRAALDVLVEVAKRHGNWLRNIQTLFHPGLIDSAAVGFWRDMLLYAGPELAMQTRCMLINLVETEGRSEAEAQHRLLLRKMIVQLVMEMGRGIVWGLSSAEISSFITSSSASHAGPAVKCPVELVKLAERLIKSTRREEMNECMLEEWIDMERAFVVEPRPNWNLSREMRQLICYHIQLLTELLKKLDKESMKKRLDTCIPDILNLILFPFATSLPDAMKRRGRLPPLPPLGAGWAEGDVRRKYMDFVVFYAVEFPDCAFHIMKYLSSQVHLWVVQKKMPIRMWDGGDRGGGGNHHRRLRTESGASGMLLMSQRPQPAALLRDADLRLLKGFNNPSYMCYVNSVLQQLAFMPGICEALYSMGELEREFGDLTEEDDIKNGMLLRMLQRVFALLIFSADPFISADLVINHIELPSGGSVREQQDCTEFFLTLIDKCDEAAEKMNQKPVFKPHLEGTMGYEYACKTCKHRHRGADESFTALNLEIHGSTVSDSLDHFMDGALLEGASAAHCDQCGEKRTTLRLGAFRQAPTTLVIQLKRFAATSYDNGGKLNTKCEIPRDLDLTRFGESVRVASDEQVEKMFGWFDDEEDDNVVFSPAPDCPVRWRYRLVGVIVHSGQLGNGHYTSYCRERRPFFSDRPWFDHWLLANDDRVSTVEEKPQMNEWIGTGEENSPSAYMLWYEMVEEDAVAERERREEERRKRKEEEERVREEEEKKREEEEEEKRGWMMEENEEGEKSEIVMMCVEERRRQMEIVRKRDEEHEWMDIGLGSIGVLEGHLLRLWRTLSPISRLFFADHNFMYQMSRDVLSESYAGFIHKLLDIMRDCAKRSTNQEERQTLYLAVLEFGRHFCTSCLWRTEDMHSYAAETIIGNYRLLIQNVINENIFFCKHWLDSFYDAEKQEISEEARLFTKPLFTIRPAINAWWLLAQHAVSALRGEQPALIEAYCRHMVECLQVGAFKIDGYASFFIHTVSSPHCVEFHIKHNILPALLHVMFTHLDIGGNAFGLRVEFTSRNSVPLTSSIFTLYRDGIDRGLIDEECCREFVETKLPLAMGPMVRHGEAVLMKVIDLMNVCLKKFADRVDLWMQLLAQAILQCLKIDQHRITGLMLVVTTVGRALPPARTVDFYDEVLGRREQDAAENGLIFPGLVYLLENMLDGRKESRLIAMIDNQIGRAMDAHPLFKEAVMPYLQRLEAAQVRAAEWAIEEQTIREQILSRTMLMGAETISSMLPMDECGPMNRPMNGGGAGDNNFGDGELMAVSDDDLDDEDDEMMSDDDDYSESECLPINRR